MNPVLALCLLGAAAGIAVVAQVAEEPPAASAVPSAETGPAADGAYAQDAAGDDIHARRVARARYNAAWHALDAGELERCAEELEALRATERVQIRNLAVFLSGNLAWRRADDAALRARGPRGGLREWDQAVAAVRAARDAWVEAAATRTDWPAARRNAERAVRRLDELEQLRAQAGGAPPEDAPESPEDAETQTAPDEEPNEQPPELPPPPSREEVEELLERVDEQQAKQLNERRARLPLDRPEVEKDW